MQGLIGGSGSTGSSVLRQLLNRHPDFYCINESSIFCKRALYNDWSNNKSKILLKGRKGLRSSGFHLFNGISILDIEYAPSQEQLARWIASSPTFKSFYNHIAEHFRKASGAGLVYEKTPGNAIHFKAFLKDNDQAKMIACIRHPIDTISSLVARGFNAYYATGIYLYNTAYALSLDKHIYHTRYEDLSQHTNLELHKIQEFLALSPLPLNKMNTTNVDHTGAITRLDSWSFDERQNMQSPARSKFKILTSRQQDELLSSIYTLKIKKSYADINHLPYNDIPSMARKFSYKLPTPLNKPLKNQLKLYRRSDIWSRTRRLYPLHFFNYPIVII